ncbi:MAG: nickel-responsive transcriptional regulator NikR [Thermoplasmata archaeon HGW-Thermoplasmata-2]|nr:MAG: nickel-responsive transcriptional regulator NikR [Thermoplasmata archaeon HGW-Thermoplasmata-2]
MPKTNKTTRISASLPSDLLARFDGVSSGAGQRSRSSAIAAAMREYISGKKWMDESGGLSGALLITYDHDARGINDALTEAQHVAGETISASMHVHLDEHRCLEMIAVRGDADKIKALANALNKTKGVLGLKVIISASE